MGLDDFASADDFADNLDDDLFDFPEIGSSGSKPAAERPAPAASSSRRDFSDDLDEPAAALPSTDPFDDELLPPKMSVDEDDDIFGFPTVDDPFAPQASAPIESTPSADDSEVEDDEPTSEDELEDVIEVTAEGQREAALDEEALERAPAAMPSPEPRMRSRAKSPDSAAAVLSLAAAPKALWVFTGASILFMVGLLSLAWIFVSAFQSQLEQSRLDALDAANRPVTVIQPPVQAPVEYSVPQSQAQPKPGVEPHAAAMPVHSIEAPHETMLIVANGAIQEGRYTEARRVLYTLLAEADRLPPEKRDVAEQEASLLIARSYKSEAEALRGSQE